MKDVKVNWLITDQNIVVNYNGQTHQVPKTHSCAKALIKALKDKRWSDIPLLVSEAGRLEKSSGGAFTIKDGEVLIDGVVAPVVLGRKIEEFSNEGLPFEPLVKFTKNLQKNPSFRAVNELYQFLEKNNHPITENGFFIAYKKVRRDFKDIHSGTFDNSPGTVVSMPRNEVNEDANQTCSYGLHVANWNYAANNYGSSSDTMLEVEVDPADVVAVPVDYNQSKMRVCKYKVLGVVDKALSTTTFRNTQVSEVVAEEDWDDAYEDDEYCKECGGDIRWPCSAPHDDLCEECKHDFDFCDIDCTVCEAEEEDDEDDYPYNDEFED